MNEGPCWLGEWEAGKTPNKGYICMDSGKRNKLGHRMWEETNLCKVNCLRELPVNILVPDSENH